AELELNSNHKQLDVSPAGNRVEIQSKDFKANTTKSIIGEASKLDDTHLNIILEDVIYSSISCSPLEEVQRTSILSKADTLGNASTKCRKSSLTSTQTIYYIND
ncbi:unnamed protein product, partial [Ceratitis capitata]